MEEDISGIMTMLLYVVPLLVHLVATLEHFNFPYRQPKHTDHTYGPTLAYLKTLGIPFNRSNDVTDSSKNKDTEKPEPDKYGLVPPFLIGASGMIVIYISCHCICVYCCKMSRNRHGTNKGIQNGETPKIVIHLQEDSSYGGIGETILMEEMYKTNVQPNTLTSDNKADRGTRDSPKSETDLGFNCKKEIVVKSSGYGERLSVVNL